MALHYLAEAAFDDLLMAWRHHDDLKARPRTAVTRLAASRRSLDEARHRMRRLREALYPTAEEHEDVLVTALCTTLDEVVHLSWQHVHPHRPGAAVCVCGELIAIHR
jgi:hypothetical protein